MQINELSNSYTSLQTIIYHQALELRCSKCFYLFSSTEFPNHQCNSSISQEEFSALLSQKKANKSSSLKDIHLYLSKLDIQSSNNDQLYPTYTLILQAYDQQGKVTNEIVLTRSLTQLIGFSKSIAKKEKENEIGKSAAQLYELLLSSHNDKKNVNVQRISVQHFLNEVLRNQRMMNMTESKAFFDYSSLKDDNKRISSVLSEKNSYNNNYCNNNNSYKRQEDSNSAVVVGAPIDYKELQRYLETTRYNTQSMVINK